MSVSTEPVGPSTGRRHRTLWIAVAAAAVIALVAGIAAFLTLRSGDPVGRQVEVRQLQPVDDGERLTAGTVQLPIGELVVDGTGPVTTVSSYVSSFDGETELDRVEGFGRWVGVGWAVRRTGVQTGRLVDGRAKQFTMALVADGTRHDLGAGSSAADDATRDLGYLGRKAVYVALAGDPDSLTLEVAYDGETQVLDLRRGKVEAGRAAPLYDQVKRRWTVSAPDCTEGLSMATPGFGPGPGDRDIPVRCEVGGTATATPYVPGRGWLPADRTYVTFWMTTGAGLPFAYWPADARGASALYFLRLQSSTLTVGGRGPAATGRYYRQDDASVKKENLTGAYYAFEVPAGAVSTGTLHQDYADLDGPGEGAPAGAPRQARGTVDTGLTLTPA